MKNIILKLILVSLMLSLNSFVLYKKNCEKSFVRDSLQKLKNEHYYLSLVHLKITNKQDTLNIFLSSTELLSNYNIKFLNLEFLKRLKIINAIYVNEPLILSEKNYNKLKNYKLKSYSSFKQKNKSISQIINKYFDENMNIQTDIISSNDELFNVLAFFYENKYLIYNSGKYKIIKYQCD